MGANGVAGRVSFLVTTYNAGRYLRQAITSASGQTYRDLEIVLVDDGTTDDSLAFLEEFEEPRLVLVRTGKIGRGKALNAALAHSTGEFIAILDSDDLAEPRRIELEVDFLRSHPKIDVVGTWSRVLDADGDEIRHLSPPCGHEEIIRTLPRSVVFNHSSVLMRASRVRSIGGYSNSLPAMLDYDLWTRLVEAGARFANIPEYLAVKRIHGKQFFEGGEIPSKARILFGVQKAAISRLGLSKHYVPWYFLRYMKNRYLSGIIRFIRYKAFRRCGR